MDGTTLKRSCKDAGTAKSGKVRCPDCGHILGEVEENGDFVMRRKGRVLRLVRHEGEDYEVDIECECGTGKCRVFGRVSAPTGRAPFERSDAQAKQSE